MGRGQEQHASRFAANRPRPYLFFGAGFIVMSVIADWGVWPVSTATRIAIALFGIAAIVISPRGVISRASVAWPLILFLSWCVISRLWDANPQLFTNEVIRFVPDAIVLMLIGGVLPTDYALNWLRRAFYGVAIFTLGWTLTHGSSSGNGTVLVAESTPGWQGTFVHKNSMAVMMVTVVALVMGYEDRRSVRNTMLACLDVLLVGSQSVTGLVGTVAVIASALWVRWYLRSPRLYRRSFVLLSLFLVGTAVALASASLSVITRLLGKDPTLSGRTKIWSASLWAIRRNPFNGYGIGRGLH